MNPCFTWVPACGSHEAFEINGKRAKRAKPLKSAKSAKAMGQRRWKAEGEQKEETTPYVTKA
jgi:hypothetical protein